MHEDWMLLAACRGRTNDMFPTTLSGQAAAVSICATCVVTTECLNYALQFPAQDMHGIWAGMNTRQLSREQCIRGIKPTMACTALSHIDPMNTVSRAYGQAYGQ